jgi:hypothetical protein
MAMVGADILDLRRNFQYGQEAIICRGRKMKGIPAK